MDTPSSIIPFHHQSFGELRVSGDCENPMFVATDVCRSLEIKNPSDALKRLEDDERGLVSIYTPGGEQRVLAVTFPGLLSLILGSRKPEAREYKRWVTHDVLPTIHTHGGYLTPQKVEEVLTDPDTIIRLATELKNERSHSRALEESVSLLADENERMLPAARQAEAFLDSRGDYTVTQAAGLLSQVDRAMTRKRLFTLLRADEMVEKRSNRATAKAVDRGYLRNVAASYFDRDGERRLRDPYAVVTPKGLDWMARRYCPAPSQPALALDCGVM